MRIRDIRESKGLSQKECAKMLGIAANTLSQYETGKREPDLNTLKQMSDILGVSTDELLGKDGIKKDPTVTVYDEDDNVIRLDDETLELIDTLRSRPEMKMLFSVSSKATKEDIIRTVKIVEALQNQEKGNHD